MNSWSPIQSGSEQDFPGDSWAIYRTKFTPTSDVQLKGGEIDFRGITGAADIYLDGEKIGSNDISGAGAVSVAIPPGAGERTLTVLINLTHSGKGGVSGLWSSDIR